MQRAQSPSKDSLNTPLIVGIGSTNPAKIKAAEYSLPLIFPGRVIYCVGCKVDSIVSAQPMSDEECITGATHRARHSMNTLTNAEYTIGMEGGIHKIGDKYFESGWIVVMNREGKIGVGSSARLELSSKFIEPIMNEKKEIAEIVDALSGQSDVRSNLGVMGILTNGILPRAEVYKHGIVFAFAPFISDKVYWD